MIAYSTISQIGYMVMGVSIAAYSAGLFHLMTHAFFKALLFMGAGSVIGAMAGIQDMDRMGGFRRAMPFTFVTFTIGALALAGFPLTAGLVLEGRDHRVRAFNRGGFYAVLAVLGYVGAFLTAFYSFRMVFRVFYGEPVPEAGELEGGHIAHGEPMNPMTGEPEDTDVGFPGPEHYIAERDWPMKAAMAPLALLSIVGGYVADPRRHDVIEKFLEPTFADSRFPTAVPSDRRRVARPGGRRRDLDRRHRARLVGLHARAGHGRTRCVERFPRVHALPREQVVLRRALRRDVRAAGRDHRRLQPARDRDRLRAGHDRGRRHRASCGWARSFARAIQTGYLRAYALLLLLGVAALTLYFLINSS